MKYLVAATSLLALIVLPVLGQSPNWMYITAAGSGARKTFFYLDLNSAKTQRDGVTTYSERWDMANPIDGSTMSMYYARGIDCATKEAVNLKDRSRLPINLDDSSNLNTVGFRQFC